MLGWYVYVIIAVPIFTFCLLVHFIVKKINEARYGERLIRLYGKASAATQVQSPLLEIESKKQYKIHEGKKHHHNKHEGISLIFSKEDNRRRKQPNVQTTYFGAKELVISSEKSGSSSRVLNSFTKMGSKISFCADKVVTSGHDVYNVVAIHDIEQKNSLDIENETIAPLKNETEDTYNKFLGTIYCKVRVSEDTIKGPYEKAVHIVENHLKVEDPIAGASHFKQNDDLIAELPETVLHTETEIQKNDTKVQNKSFIECIKIADSKEITANNTLNSEPTNSILKESKENIKSATSRVTFVEPENANKGTGKTDVQVEGNDKKDEPKLGLASPTTPAENPKSLVENINFFREKIDEIPALAEHREFDNEAVTIETGENLKTLLGRLTYCEDNAAVKFIPSKDDYTASIINRAGTSKPCNVASEKTVNLGVDKSLECTIEPSSIDVDFDDTSLDTNETTVTEDSRENPKV